MVKKKVKNNKKPKNKVKITKTPLQKEGLIISFSYPNWIKGVQTKDITTFTESEEEFMSNFIYIMYELVPYVYDNWGRYLPHCHSINQLKKERSREAREKYLSLIQVNHPEIISPSTKGNDDENYSEVNDTQSVEYQTGQLEDLDLYQIGLKRSIRVICGKVENTLYPLLIDHHHLGYDSQKYNHRDTSKFGYCPIKSHNND